jgi:hypothetical protein
VRIGKARVLTVKEAVGAVNVALVTVLTRSIGGNGTKVMLYSNTEAVVSVSRRHGRWLRGFGFLMLFMSYNGAVTAHDICTSGHRTPVCRLFENRSLRTLPNNDDAMML